MSKVRASPITLFEFPAINLKTRVFLSIAELRSALKEGIGSERARFGLNQNKKYLSLKCKVPGCPAALSYLIVEGQDER